MTKEQKQMKLLLETCGMFTMTVLIGIAAGVLEIAGVVMDRPITSFVGVVVLSGALIATGFIVIRSLKKVNALFSEEKGKTST